MHGISTNIRFVHEEEWACRSGCAFASCLVVVGGGAAATVGGWLLQMILCVAAAATQLELLSPLILGLHVMWKTPWAGSTSSSDDRGFTCQLVFTIPSRFVVYSTESTPSYVKYFPITVRLKDGHRDYILFCTFWIRSATNRAWRSTGLFVFCFLVFCCWTHSSEHACQAAFKEINLHLW